MNIPPKLSPPLPRRRRRAMTLVELLVSLSILTMVSTAVVSMLCAGAQTTSAISSSITTQWEVETAVTRMVQQARLCSTLNIPTGISGGTAYSITTQPDAANGNLTYAVSYSLVSVSGVLQLQENDSRYGVSVLLHDVQSFDVRYKSATGPVVVIVTMTVGTNPPVSRIFRIAPRNL